MTAKEVQTEVRKHADPRDARILARFFKTGPGEYGEGDRFLGLRVPLIRRFVRRYAALSRRGVGALLKSAYHEERLLALLIMVHRFQRGDEAERKSVYDLYLAGTAHVNSWDLVDLSAEPIVGAWLRDRGRKPLYRLARSASVWERRIALLATFHYIRRRDFADTFALVERLLGDPHDLIHKAAGWMLREIGKRDPAAEERFLDAHRQVMPRTMLRYAIERFPEARRRFYLETGGTGSSRRRPAGSRPASGTPKVKTSSATPVECWHEWRRVCALGRCSEASRECLGRFARNRFRGLIDRYAHLTGVGDARALAAGVGPREAWHLLEYRFVVGSTKSGKRYKDWLFARVARSSAAPLDVIRGGATLIMRDAVREYLRREFPPPRTRTLNRVVRVESGRPVTMQDLLPVETDFADDLARREYSRLAREHAGTFFAGMRDRERLVMLARGFGIPLSSALLAKIGRCRKSVLNQAYRSFVERLAGNLRHLYPEEESPSVMRLSQMTLAAVTELTIHWGKSEKRLAAFFHSIEEGTDVEAQTARA